MVLDTIMVSIEVEQKTTRRGYWLAMETALGIYTQWTI